MPPNRSRKILGALIATSAAVSVLVLAQTASEPGNRGAQPANKLPAEPVAQPTIPGLPADRHLDKAPPRPTKALSLVKMGWSYNCMECHRLLKAKWHYDRPMVEHDYIKLEHGGNRFCLNCHHPTNRNAFVDYDGSEIAQADVFMLCAKCHGPTYRDWKAGVHGRRNGYWNVSKGPQTQLHCIQCHDPHEPRIQAMKPLAPLRYPPRAPQSSTPHTVANRAH